MITARGGLTALRGCAAPPLSRRAASRGCVPCAAVAAPRVLSAPPSWGRVRARWRFSASGRGGPGGVPRGPLLASARRAAARRCGASRLALAPPALALSRASGPLITRPRQRVFGVGAPSACGPRISASGGNITHPRPLPSGRGDGEHPPPLPDTKKGQRPLSHTRRRFNKTTIYFVES